MQLINAIIYFSEKDLLNHVLHLIDLGLLLRVGMAQDDGGYDGSGNTAGTAQVGLLGHVNVGDIHVLAEEGQM